MTGLALMGAASWGVGDFLGGLAARRAHVLTVLVGSQLLGLAGAIAWVATSHDARPAVADILPALGAGAAGMVGLAALYRGLAVGAMGIVAPISGASTLVPLAVDLAHGTAPTAPQLVGIAAVLGGIAVLSRAAPEPGLDRSAGLAAGVTLALIAALGFGLFLVGIDAAADASVPWAVAFARGAGASLALGAALVVRAPLVPTMRVAPQIAAVGLFDTGANVLLALATTRGAVGIVGVLGSLYPLATVALARLVLGEKLDWPRRVGALVAVGGAALVAAG